MTKKCVSFIDDIQCSAKILLWSMSALPCRLVKGFGIKSVFILLVQVDTLKATELTT